MIKAKVISLDDPNNSGRVKINIMSLYDINEDQDIMPYAKIMSGIDVSIGDIVYIEFEGDTRSYPVIIGVFQKNSDINRGFNNYNSLNSSLSDYVVYDGTPTSLAKIAAQIIFGNEGNYDTVTGNDNGAISIGKIQWHGNRAKELMSNIRNRNSSKFDNICLQCSSSDFVTSQMNTSWEKFTLDSSSSYYKAIKEILATDESHEAQDELALRDVQQYLDRGKSRGVTSIPSLLYYADLDNQYGCGGVKKFLVGDFNNIDSFHTSTLNIDSTYITRRTRTYNTIKELESQGKLVPCNNDMTSNPVSQALNCKVVYPVKGFNNISSKFGSMTRYINGLYILNKGINISGTDSNGNSIDHQQVLSALDGTVEINDNPVDYYGKYVKLNVNNDYMFMYCNLNTITVQNGQSVKAGDVIGTVGQTGNVNEPLLHLKLLKNPFNFGEQTDYGDCIDPEPYILGIQQLRSKISDVISWALSKIGCTYDQTNRFAETSFDCSSLMYRAFKAYNVDIGVYGTTAASECSLLETNSDYGSFIGMDQNNWQPGDLIFWSFGSNDRYKNITHVAMYLGNNEIVEAANEDDGIRRANVYCINDIRSVCRVKM